VKRSALFRSLIGTALVFICTQRVDGATVNIADFDVFALRNAIATASSNNEDDTINLASSGTYTIPNVDNTTNGPNGLPVVAADGGHTLTINGNGATIWRSTSNGTPNFRILYLGIGASVTINGVTLRNAALNPNDSGPNGGAIYNDRGTLTLNNCTLNGNGALDGGGIYNYGVGGSATVTVNSCTLINNSGEAIYNNNATLTLTNCTLANNTGGGAIGAGAIYNNGNGNGSAATTTLSSCTFYRNSHNSGAGGDSVTNDARNPSGNATLVLRNTVFVYGVGGRNFYNVPDNLGHTNLEHINSSGFNLTNDQFAAFTPAASDQINTDPKFDPSGLKDNGGPTQTIALTYSSPAIDKGNSFGVVTDQRGNGRPYDNPSFTNTNGGDGSDIGAFEAGADPVQYPPFTVTTTADHDDGVCGGVDCTLREAIARASSLSDSVQFAPGITGTITLQAGLGELSVAGNINIYGPGARVLAISGGGTHRVFNFSGPGGAHINDLTIRDGVFTSPPGTGAARIGGAVYNQTQLVFTNCAFVNNSVLGASNNADGGNGGAGRGGAIFNTGELVLSGCTFGGAGGNANAAGGAVGTANSSQTGFGGSGGVGQGGAVFNDTSGSLSIYNCTFNGNHATGGAGGSGHFGGAGGNANGGAVFNQGTMTLTSATVSGNTGNGGAGGGTGINRGPNGSGNGGLSAASGSTDTAANTIVAGNTASTAPDAEGTFTSSGYNLIGIGDQSSGFSSANQDQVGTTAAAIDPKLGPLQNNGGPTDTMAPLSNSPTTDQGKSFGLATDQRGRMRPFDSSVPNAAGGDGSDIGALELGGGLAPFNAASRKFHGSISPAPFFDIVLPLTGPIGVECRRNTVSDVAPAPNAGRDHELIVTFPGNVTVGSAQVTDANTGSSAGTASFSVSSNVVTVDLHSAPNGRRLSINLGNVSDGTDTVNLSILMGVLLGDANGNGRVSNSDVSSIQAQVGASVGASNFRNDVNANGTLSNGDVAAAQAQVGAQLPP
jgi:fibronectin-binding autotransporter adhesin